MISIVLEICVIANGTISIQCQSIHYLWQASYCQFDAALKNFLLVTGLG